MKTDPTNLLKGKVAESIVRYMFEASGKRVYFSGVEGNAHIMNEMIDDVPYSEALSDFFSIPDFIVQHEDGMREFVEVKYRKKGLLEQGDIPKFNRLHSTWKPTIVILAIPDSNLESNIRVIQYPYYTSPDRNNIHVYNIEQYEQWSLNPEVVQQCIRMVRSFFAEFTSAWNVTVEQRPWI